MDLDYFLSREPKIKGIISSFRRHLHFEPIYRHKFNFYGQQWNSIQEAYDALEEPDMDEHKKLNLMGQIIYFCFKQSDAAAAELISTQDYWIENRVTNHDNFWHNCKCKDCFCEAGNNYYGRLLMEVRDRFIWEKKPKKINKKRWNIKYFDKQVLY